jgi:hypothetical protein
MKLLRILSLIALAQFSHANEEAIAAAKLHLGASLQGDRKVLVESYAPKISLKPGHEFLKKQYGLVGEGGRAEGAEVERDPLVAVIVKAVAARPVGKADRIDAMLKSLTYTAMTTEVGDFAADPSDPGGKLHFAIKAGDVLLKAAPPKGDFVLFQLRKTDGKWQVVGEYLD